MRTAQEAIERLGHLTEEDRRWILGRLSVSARARLAEATDEMQLGGDDDLPISAKPSDEPSLEGMTLDDFDWSESIAVLSAANTTVLAQTLQSEPAWLVDAVLRAANWPWAPSIKKSFSPALRADLAALGRERSRLGKPATQTLLRELAHRSKQWPPEQRRASRWSRVLNRFGINGASR